jgi:WD40 repeat protein
MQLLKGHGYQQTIYSLAFAPDGSVLASCALDGTVRLWDLSTGEAARVLPAHYSTHSVCFSADGCWLAWGNRSQACVLEVEGTEPATYPVSGQGYNHLTRLIFLPDPRRLLGVLRRHWHVADVVVLDRGSGEWTPWPGTEDCTDALAVSADGRTVATAHQVGRPGSSGHRYAHTVRLWDAATRREQARLEGHGNQITTLAFSPDGKHLAVTCGVSMWVWDVGARKVAAQFKYDARHFKSSAFSPDGRWLATARNDATVRFFDTASWAEGPSFDWKIGPVVVVAFARDGMRAACGGSKGKIVVWDVDV